MNEYNYMQNIHVMHNNTDYKLTIACFETNRLSLSTWVTPSNSFSICNDKSQWKVYIESYSVQTQIKHNLPEWVQDKQLRGLTGKRECRHFLVRQCSILTGF